MDGDTLAACTLDALSTSVEQMAAAQMAMLVGLLEMIYEYDRREGWQVDGLSSMVDWITARLAVSRYTAAAWLDAARRLPEQPAIRAAAAAGEISWDQLRPLLRLATPASDRMWAKDGPALKPAQLEHMARRQRPITPEEDEESRTRQGVRFYRGRDGMLHITGRLTDESAATVQNGLRRRAEQNRSLPLDGETATTWEQRLADALVEMASTNLAADTDADAAAVVVHTDARVLQGWPGNADIEGGGVISGDALHRLFCDCNVRWVIYDKDGTVTVTEAKATIPRWLRRLVKGRDLVCRFPGCTRTGWGQIHHIVWRSHGGQTKMDLLVFLCWEHHHAVHEGGWQITGNADAELTFISPNGHRYTSRPAGLRRDVGQRLFGPEWEPAARPPWDEQSPPSRN